MPGRVWVGTLELVPAVLSISDEALILILTPAGVAAIAGIFLYARSRRRSRDVNGGERH